MHFVFMSLTLKQHTNIHDSNFITDWKGKIAAALSLCFWQSNKTQKKQSMCINVYELS